MVHRISLVGETFVFQDLKHILASASPLRSGDELAGIAARDPVERVAAREVLANLPLRHFLTEAIVPYETDEVTRLIMDSHDEAAFAPISHMTVGQFRDWLLSYAADTSSLEKLSPGLTPEMVAAVSKLMRNQDLVSVGRKMRVVSAFRNTQGLPARLGSRLQPNHPTDDPDGISAALLDGLLLGAGDAVLGINPASDHIGRGMDILWRFDDIRQRFDMPVQSCLLTHVTNTITMIEKGAPVDLVFQSIAGSEQANAGFGISLGILSEAWQAARELNRGTVGTNVMYFETGQGSALSSGTHHGVDQQTMEVRAYAVARVYSPLLVNTVVGFIGPEYLYDGKQ
ncbi:MAG: ethanolamine ammonia-lyase subunit EutB, partial [Gluconobacter oxydans]|uniref:ethanolamine ammonia-lyase subunit EutB n=1 Tax=Gluconobacter oxydans TaxID=442 RepID=UPI0039EAA704